MRRIPYSAITSIEYGQKAGRRIAAAIGTSIALGPVGLALLASHKRKHIVTLSWTVDGHNEAAEPDEPIRYSPELEASLPALIKSVKAQGFEGLVAKSRKSHYEPGQRTGAWQKMRLNQGQELVIGGYTPSLKNFDALVIGYYDNGQLMYAARTRNGFTPRVGLFRKLKPVETEKCPFANLPEKKAGRWGAGLTAEKMRECHWLTPVLVGQFEFVQRTDDGHLRHSRFVALREDKKARDVRRE
jgi:bifunctional non-homologous end joining protein LigD